MWPKHVGWILFISMEFKTCVHQTAL
jgi:hypothetical protein